MPKVTKLHSKGKPTKIQKCDKNRSADSDPQESAREFQLQLYWCIQQLERTLAEKKGNEKQLQEAWKVLTVLKNNNQPTIRKRQLMRTHFGDYRAKMAAEEKKLAKMASKIKICDSPAQPKATFLRKSAFLSTGNSSFRFNFDIPQEAKENTIINNETVSSTSLQELNSNEVCPISILKEDKNANHSQNMEKIHKVESNAVKELNSDRFKFSSAGSEFRFNFNVEDEK